MMTMTVLGLGFTGYAAVAGRYNVGKAFRRSAHALGGVGGQARDAVQGWFRSKFTDVKITRETVARDPSKIVLKFDRMHTVDFDGISKKIAEYDEQSARIGAAKLTTQQLSEQQRQLETSGLISGEEYEVLVTVDKDMLCGELDFASWTEAHGFEVKIYRKIPPGDRQEVVDQEKRAEVLETLRRFAKLTNQHSPTDKVVDALPENTLWNWGASWFGGNNTSVSLNLQGGLNGRLLEHKRVSELQQVALSRATSDDKGKRDDAIFPNFLDAVTQAKQNELLRQTKRRRELEIKLIREKIADKGSRRFWIIAGISAVATVSLTVAALAALNIFLPGVGAVITPFVVGAVAGAANFVVSKAFSWAGGLMGFGLMATAAVTIFKTRHEWKREGTAIVEGQLKACTEETEALKEELEDLSHHKVASKKVLGVIVGLKDSNGRIKDLDLSYKGEAKQGLATRVWRNTLGRLSKSFGKTAPNKVDDLSIGFIAQAYDSKNPVLAGCESINLAGNCITGAGVSMLSEVLVQAQMVDGFRLRELNLTGNPIITNEPESKGLAGIIALQGALTQNLTICKLDYTIPSDLSVGDMEKLKIITQDIDRQLMINCKLQGVKPDPEVVQRLTGIGDPIATSEEALKQAIRKKVEANASITVIPGGGTTSPEILGLLEQNLKQNKLFGALLEKPTMENYLETYKVDPDRCDRIIATHGELNAELVKKLKEQIIENLKKGPLLIELVNHENGVKILESLFPQCKANIVKFVAAFGKLSEYNDPARAYMEVVFSQLNTKPEQFGILLKQQRDKIAKDRNISEKLRNELLNNFDLALDPNMTKDQLEIHQLLASLSTHPDDKEVETLKGFLTNYGKLEGDKWQYFSTKSPAHGQALVDLMQHVVGLGGEPCKEVFGLLHDIPRDRRIELLTACFSKYPNEENPREKALMVSAMLDASAGIFDTSEGTTFGSYGGREIYYAITAKTNGNILTGSRLKEQLQVRQTSLSKKDVATVEHQKQLDAIAVALDPKLIGNKEAMDAYRWSIFLVNPPKDKSACLARFILLRKLGGDSDSYRRAIREIGSNELTTWIASDAPNNFKLLREAALSKEQYQQLFESLFAGDEHAKERANILVELLLSGKEEAIKSLWKDGNFKSHEKMRQAVKDLRANAASEAKDYGAVREELDAHDKLIHPKDSSSSARRARQWLTEHPDNLSKMEILSSFVGMYKKLSKEDLEPVFYRRTENGKSELRVEIISDIVSLLQKAISNKDDFNVVLGLLKDLSEDHRLLLLETYFSIQDSEGAGRKAKYVSTMLDSPSGMFDGYGSGHKGNELFYCFSSGGILGGMFLVDNKMLTADTLEKDLRDRQENLSKASLATVEHQYQLDAIAKVLHPGFDDNATDVYRWEIFLGNPPKDKSICLDRFLLLSKNSGNGDSYRQAMEKIDSGDLTAWLASDAPNFERIRNAGLSEERYQQLFESLFAGDHAKERTNILMGLLSDGKDVADLWDIKAKRFKSYEEMREAVKGLRAGVASKAEDYGIVKKKLDAHDRLIHPGEKPSDMLVRRTRQWLTEHPDNLSKVEIFSSFVAMYKDISPEDLERVFYREKEDDELELREEILSTLISLLKEGISKKDDFNTVLNLLKELPEKHRLTLLEACFSNDEYYPNEENPYRKALIVSAMLDAPPGIFNGWSNNNELWYCFSYEYTSSQLMEKLSELKEKRDPAKLASVNGVIKQVHCAELEANYPQSKVASSIMPPDTSKDEEMIEELKAIYDVSDFGDLWPNASQEVQKAKQQVAYRNKLIEAVNTSDSEKLWDLLNSKSASHLEFALDDEEVQVAKLSGMIQQDLGSYSRGMLNLGGSVKLTCEHLKLLDEKNLGLLFTKMFLAKEKSPEDAEAKGKLVAALLKSPELFSGTGKAMENLRYDLYFTATGYYDFKQVREKMVAVLNDKSLDRDSEIAKVLQSVLQSPEDQEGLKRDF